MSDNIQSLVALHKQKPKVNFTLLFNISTLPDFRKKMFQNSEDAMQCVFRANTMSAENKVL